MTEERPAPEEEPVDEPKPEDEVPEGDPGEDDAETTPEDPGGTA